MDIATITELITNVGFPIACVIALAWFIFYTIQKTNEANKENMKQVQERCNEREDKLYAEIKETREVNAKAIETIARYSEKLEDMQQDIKEIKTDVTTLIAK
ncbi:MAG: hypothetical protein ACI3T9_01365 [Romboutsia timonensis]